MMQHMKEQENIGMNSEHKLLTLLMANEMMMPRTHKQIPGEKSTKVQLVCRVSCCLIQGRRRGRKKRRVQQQQQLVANEMKLS
uniref:Uncharacterized protein n=1 Tax=Leersia perrieri TaxID=77586 RepID=A0A0D9WVN1_9ORYZ